MSITHKFKENYQKLHIYLPQSKVVDPLTWGFVADFLPCYKEAKSQQQNLTVVDT